MGKSKFSFAALGLVDNGHDACLENIAFLAQTLLGADGALVSVMQPAKAVQYISASSVGCVTEENRRFPLEQSICRLVFTDKKPVLIEDLTADMRTKALEPVRVSGLRSYVGVPVHAVSGKVIGSLCCFWTTHMRLDETHIALLERLARGVDDIIRARVTVLEKDRTNARLTKMLAARSSFASHLSHEIRTPLTGLVGSIKLLTAMELEEKPRELVKLLDRSSARLLTLVNDTLDFAKLDSGNFQINEDACNIGELAREIVESARIMAEGKDVVIGVTDHLGGDLFMADRHALDSVIHNLFWNAVKFTHAGSAQIILSRNPDDGVDITVADTGIGIAEEAQGTIFEEFQQANPRIARKYGGTGLGMAIVKRLVDLMDGEISLKSKQGVGTTITVSLPLDPVRKTWRVLMANPAE